MEIILEKSLKIKKITNKWGAVHGNSLKVCPKGFDKNHPNIDLLRYKQFIFVKNFQDEMVLEDNFSDTIKEYFKLLLPFHDYFSDVLTTDLNGQSIIKLFLY